MFAPFEYLLTITLITSYYLLSFTAIPLAILCTTVGLFGDWTERIGFLKHLALLRECSSDATAFTTTDTNNITTDADTTPSSTSKSHEKDGTPPSSSTPSAAQPSRSTPARVRGAAFALALLRLWSSGEIRALSQFMLTGNLLILVGYGGLWVWVRYGGERGFVG